MEHKEEVRKFLMEKILEISARLVAYYLVELKGTDEDKKTLNASLFMEGLLTGNLVKEEEKLYEKYSKEFEELWSYIGDYNSFK